MEEYINDAGDLYTIEEINQAAEENKTTFEDIIKKNKLSPNKKQETVTEEVKVEEPGKPKPVVKKDAVATAKSTASKSVKPSSVSPDNPFGKTKTFDPFGLDKFNNTPAQKPKKQVEFNPKKFAEEISSQAGEGFYAKGEKNIQRSGIRQKELETKTVDEVFNNFDNLNYSKLSDQQRLELDNSAIKILNANNKPGTQYKFTPNEVQLKAQEILTKASDKKKGIEGASYLDRVVSGVAAGANYVGESFASIPETVYRVFALPQNAVAAITGDKDLEVSPEKLKKQTGTTNPVMDYFVDEQKRIQKNNNIYDNANYDSTSITENLKNGNYSDAFKLLGTGLAESAPISIGMMAGGANMSIGKLAAASTLAMAGPEVRQQKEANPELSEIENVMNGFGMAGAESVFSAIGEGSIGKVYKDIIKKEGLDTGSKIFKDGLISTYQTALKKYGVPTAMLGEGLEEVATTITQNLISKKPAFDNTMDSFIAGVGGGAVWGSPITLQKSIEGFKDGLTVHKINTELKTGNASNLKEVFNPNTPITETQIKIASIPNSYKILTSQIDNDIAADNMTIEEGDKIKMEFAATYHAANQLKPLDLPSTVSVEVSNLLKDRDQLNRVIKNVNDPTLTTFQSDKVKEINSRISELTSTIAKEKLAKNLAVLNKNVGVASKLAKLVGKQEFENPITNPDGTVDALVSFDTQEEGQKALDEYNEKMGLPKSKLSNTVGTNLGNGQIIINKELAAKTLEFNVGGHELLHKILISSFQTLTKKDLVKATELKDKFLSVLNAEELAAVNKRILDVDENKERLYTDEYLKENPDEYITQFFETVAEKKLTWSDKLSDMFAKIGDLLLPFFKEKGFDNLQFQDGKDVYDFIKDYNKNLRRGKLSKRAIALGDQGINIPQSQTFSKTAAELKTELSNIKENEFEYNDPLEYDQEVKRVEAELKRAIAKEATSKPVVKKEVSEEDEVKEIIKNDKGSVSSDKVQQIYEAKGLNGADEIIKLFRPITNRIVNKRKDAPGFEEELLRDEIETGEGGILYLIRSYKPEKGVPLAAYINKQLPLRAIASSKRILDESFSKDVTEEKALIAEETVSEVKEKPKYKNALESKVFPPEVLETAYKKIITVMRTLKSRIDAPVSLNRTVTPLISEIKDEIGKLLDIDIKTMLGGKKDGVLRKELLRNKRYILENMTTTWLMAKDGQGGIPQAIQKQIDGKWVNFPDWVGQKIDREKTTTDQAGRTSGAEIVRRLPNVANNISDEVFLAQIIGPDGNPIRGRKESLSKAMAEEGAFDIINNDLEEQGLIYDALKTNQERLGYEVTNIMATEVARQADRGNVKQSRIGVGAIDRVSNEFYNFYKDLDSITKSNVLQYLDKRETKYLKNINEDDENDLLNILSKWQGVYIDNIAKLEAKFFDEKNQKFKEEFNNINDFDKYLLKEVESLKTSKAATLKLAPSGLDFNAKNIATINEIKTAVKKDLEQKLNDAKTDNEKINVVNSFLRTYRAIFTGGTVGKRLYGTNSELFKELNTIKGFKDLGYALKGKDNKASIVNKLGVNPTFVYEQSASAKDIGYSIKSGKDAIAAKKRNNENTQSLKDVLNFVDWVKKSNMTNKAKAMLSIALGTSTYSPLRTLAKIDSIILDTNIKDPKNYVWEHALPIDEMVRGILSYVLDLPIGLKPVLNKKDLKALLNESKVSIIPRNINSILNKILKDKMPSDWKVGDNIYNARYFSPNTLTYLIKEGIDLKQTDLVKLTGREGIIKAINFENRKQNIQNINNIEAVTKSLNPKFSKTPKGISVFDFDDTIGLTKSNVLYTMPDGTKGKLNAEEFAKDGASLLEAGAVFDFSEFSKVTNGKPGPMVEKMKKMIGKFGPDNFFILTARPADSAGPIHQFLSSIGIDIPLENITGLGNSAAQAKADWMTAKAAEGYNDFYFADDAIQNVEAVKKALDIPGVDSKVQQAMVKFSLTSKQDLKWRQGDEDLSTNFKVGNNSYRIALREIGMMEYDDDISTALLNIVENNNLDYDKTIGDIDGNAYDVEFSDKKRGTGITGTGNAAEVFGTVLNGVIELANKRNIKAFTFNAKEPSRIKLYNSMTNIIADRLGWDSKAENGTYLLYDKSLIQSAKEKTKSATTEIINNSSWEDLNKGRIYQKNIKAGNEELKLQITNADVKVDFDWDAELSDENFVELIKENNLDPENFKYAFEPQNTKQFTFINSNEQLENIPTNNISSISNAINEFVNGNNIKTIILSSDNISDGNKNIDNLFKTIATNVSKSLNFNLYSKEGSFILTEKEATIDSEKGIGSLPKIKDVLNVVDIKSPIQKERIKFSKTISPEFNKIIEENTGMADYKVFSDIVARRRGADKNKFDFYVPPSAADFELLLYNFIGKGKRGEEQQKFFADALLKPYANGNDLMDAARQSIKKDYKVLTDQFPDIKNKIEKLTPDGDFTYDQAIRVAMWTEEGVEIPGISQRDQKKLTELVNNDTELAAFKQGLIVTGRQGKGWVTPTEFWDASTIISDLHNLTEGEGRKKFLAEFIDNAQEMFGKWENGKLVGPNINKVEAVYGTNVREAIEDVLYRMTTGKNRSQGKDKETSMWANWVTGSTGAIMFLNVRSAALQLIGATNFLNLRDNNPIAAAAAFANQKQYWEDFARIWNSDKMKERRGGLKEDVAAAEIANAAAGSKNKVGAVLSYLLKIGYTPTQMADSFAIASGGAPFYRNRIKSYLKEGQSQTEAEANAWNDFTKVSDETQQSGDPRDISKQQASAAGRLLLTFQNTAMQQSRIVKKAILDLKNRRGDDKTNVAKIAYYLAIQNTMFAVLQQGLFAVAFGYDDEDKEKPEKEKKLNEKLVDIADGVVDTILRGTGFVGGIVATLKNMAKKYLEEKDKKFKADYAKVMLEGANISPPIGSKLRKLYSGLQQSKFEKDLIKERGWGVMQDGRIHLGPMYGVSGKLVESFTNVPMDRLVTKIENASQAMNSQNQAWQRVMVGLGWSPYSIGIEDSTGDQAIRAKAKEIRAEEGKIKAKETRERTKDSIKALPIEERIKLKREAALKRREEKLKKRKRKMG